MVTGNGRADVHLHTTISDGILSPQAVVNEVILRNISTRRAQRAEVIDVIAVTDHDSVEGGLAAQQYLNEVYGEDELQVIVGAEISTRDGHLIGLDLRRDVVKGMSALETIDAIHEQGGLAIAVHPYAYLPLLKDFKGIGRLIHEPAVGPKLDAVEVRNSNPTETFNNYYTQLVDHLTLRHAQVGGSDAHFPSAIGHTWTIFPGRTAADLLRAIRVRTTRPGGQVYGLRAVLEYYHDRMKWKQFCMADPIRRVYHDW